MSTAHWEQVKSLFHAAMELPAPERVAFLETKCKGDAGLRQEVESLLKSAGSEVVKTGGAAHALGLDDTAGLGAGNTRSTMTHIVPITETAGTVIGPYKLLQVIGEGGFGTVFLAEQHQPVRRRVALKIIKLGMDTKSVVARFEAERQALALMEHPHIARVLDGGATDTGRPYFVMEYVVGDSITKFADAHSLTVNERLDLFQQVCSAVQHAHTKGIIHRDLKPGNVLVSMVDGKPFAKVIDFGIAKATAGVGGALTDKTLFTEHKLLIGTPEYMSPEQAEGSMDIDTRTDVYSLGVLLYELLTGTTPIDSTKLRSAAYDEMRRMIREDDPPMPSMKLSRLLDRLAATAAARKVEPSKLSTIVKGELDWIVMKALEKERGRRYETANALGDDVRRHLLGDAVIAAPVSRAYRFGKFVKKNKAACVLILVSTVGVVATSGALVAAQYNAHAANKNAALAMKAKNEAEWSSYQATLALAQAALASGFYPEARRLMATTIDSNCGWESKFLNQQAESVVWRLALNADWLDVSADGRRAVTTPAYLTPDNELNEGNSCSVLDVIDGKELAVIDAYPQRILSASMSPDSRSVLTHLQDGSACVWNAELGTLILDIESRNEGAMIQSATFDRSGRHVIVTARAGTIRWISVATGRSDGMEVKLTCENDNIPKLYRGSISPDDTTIAVACNNEVIIVDALHRVVRSRLVGHTERVSWACIDPTGTRVASSANDDTCCVWDIKSAKLLYTLRGTGAFGSASFCPDGSRVLTGGSNKWAVWNAFNGERISRLSRLEGWVGPDSVSTDGSLIVAADSHGRIAMMSADGFELFPLETDELWENVIPRFAPDRATVIMSGLNRRIGKGMVVQVIPTQALGGPVQVISSSESPNVIDVWDELIVGGANKSRHLTTPDGSRRIVGGADKTVRFFEARDGKPTLPATADSPDGVYREVAVFRMDDAVTHLQMTDDGTRLIISLADGSARIWDIRDPSERRKDLEREWAERVPAGEYLDGLWDIPPETLPTDSIQEKIIADASLTPLRRLVAVEMLEERLEDTRIAAEEAFAKIVQQAEKETEAWKAIDTVRMKVLIVSAAVELNAPVRVKDIVMRKANEWSFVQSQKSESARLAEETKARKVAEANLTVSECESVEFASLTDAQFERLLAAEMTLNEVEERRAISSCRARAEAAGRQAQRALDEIQRLKWEREMYRARAEYEYRSNHLRNAIGALHNLFSSQGAAGPTQPFDAALLALSRWRAAESDEATFTDIAEFDTFRGGTPYTREQQKTLARESLVQARALMQPAADGTPSAWAEDADAKALLAEAESLIGQ